jgi:uncharacterized protein with ParB-like and HNH nuclease domain
LGEQLSYISSNVAGVLDRINRSYFLPAIQRPFVWQPDQIVALFDSLLKGYLKKGYLLRMRGETSKQVNLIAASEIAVIL